MAEAVFPVLAVRWSHLDRLLGTAAAAFSARTLITLRELPSRTTCRGQSHSATRHRTVRVLP